MNIDEVRLHRNKLIEIANLHHAGNLRVFGSAARNETGTDSDVDFLVHFDEKASLMDLSALDIEFSEVLGVKVDIIPDDSLHEDIKRFVLDDSVEL